MFISIPKMLLVGVILYATSAIFSKWIKYNKWLNYNKSEHEYQTMNIETLIKIYKAIGSDNFDWDHSSSRRKRPHLLWYRISYHYYLIDMSWFACVRFRMWERKYLRKQRKVNQEVAICRNSTNEVLQNVQKRLDDQIQRNCQKMKDAAVQQGEVLSRLSGFEKDYVKSQITRVC